MFPLLSDQPITFYIKRDFPLQSREMLYSCLYQTALRLPSIPFPNALERARSRQRYVKIKQSESFSKCFLLFEIIHHIWPNVVCAFSLGSLKVNTFYFVTRTNKSMNQPSVIPYTDEDRMNVFVSSKNVFCHTNTWSWKCH